MLCTKYMVSHPRGNCIVSLLLSLEVTATENMQMNLKLLSTCKKVRARCESPPHRRYLVGCNSHPTCDRLVQHVTALRAWCTRCLPGRWKPDMLRPGIAEMRGSIVLRPRLCMKLPPPPSPGDRWRSQTTKQEGDEISKRF